MINIFGKLYTLLRRPNQQNATPETASPSQEETPPDGATQEPVDVGLTDSQSSDWIHVKSETGPSVLNMSGTDLDAIQAKIQPDALNTKESDQAMSKEVAGNNTMDMEAMSKLVEEMQTAEEDKVGDNCEGVTTTTDSTLTIETEPSINNESENEKETKDMEKENDKKSIQMNKDETKVTEKVIQINEDETKATEKAIQMNEDESKASEKEMETLEKVDHVENSSTIAPNVEDETSKDKKHIQDNNQGDTVETSVKKVVNSQRRPCKYFSRGQKCFKRNRCPYSHDRDTPAEKEPTDAPTIREEDFETYNDFVNAMTAQGRNIFPKELVYKLGYQKCGMDALGLVVKGQHKLAISKQRWHWVSQARYFADLLFPHSWIDENLPTKDGPKKSGRAKEKQKKTKYNMNEQYEGRRGMCQDVRLLENPNLPCISSNFGKKKKEAASTQSAGNTSSNVEKFVTDYTNGIINEAVRIAVEETHETDESLRGAIREAMDEGLSESIIMEVIDDLTNTTGSQQSSRTPSKRGKVNKLDAMRTPRQRPDELAIGFNYLSEELVKHSPKTVDGGIICMDTLPPSKERPEQLAFGFSFHADELVKDSPISDKGEILIPGVVLTPGRKARDQLAMGFNYHSNLIVKESPKSLNTQNKSKHQGRKKKLYQADDVADENKYVNGHQIDHTGDACFNSKGRIEKERFAIGFSKNAELLAHADKMVVNVLGEVDANLAKQHTGDLELSLDEERNNSELDDSFVPTMVPTMLPAGSLW